MHFVSACKHDKEGTLLFRKRWNVRFSRVGNFDTVRSIDSLLSSGFWMSRVSSIVRRSELYRVLYCDGCGFVWYHGQHNRAATLLLARFRLCTKR